MSIRSAAKAIIIHKNKILINRCSDRRNGAYYSLPGGGQNDYETLYDAVIRECREETGYLVKPNKLGAVCEEICMDAGFRQQYPDYAHKMYHIFLCELADETRQEPTEMDSAQIDCDWVDLHGLSEIRLLPKSVGSQIRQIIEGTAPFFLGSEHIELNHG